MSPADIVQLSQGLFHYLQREILFPETNINNALIFNTIHIHSNDILTKWLQQKEGLQQFQILSYHISFPYSKGVDALEQLEN